MRENFLDSKIFARKPRSHMIENWVLYMTKIKEKNIKEWVIGKGGIVEEVAFFP